MTTREPHPGSFSAPTLRPRVWLPVLILLILGALALSLFGRRWLLLALRRVWALGPLGALAYGLIYVGGTVLMFPGTLLTLGAGLLYGVTLGSLIAIPASLIGAGLAFLIARALGREWVERRLVHGPRLAALDRAVAHRGWKFELLLRLDPVVLQFAPLNYALGLTAVRFRDYMLASWLGMMPATIFYVWLGSKIPSLVALFSGPTPQPGHLALLWVGAAVGVAALLWLARLAQRALRMELDAPEEHS